jgi:putative transposase
VTDDIEHVTLWPDWHVGDVFGIRAATADVWVVVELVERRVEDSTLVFRNRADGKLILPPMPLEAALALLEQERLRLLPSNVRDDRHIRDLPPDSGDKFWRLRLAITCAFDDDQATARHARRYSKSSNQLNRLVSDVLARRPDLALLGWVPSAGAVRKWIQNRGSSGRRQAADMVDRSGQGDRKKNLRRQRILLVAARWYWSLDTRTVDDTYARVRTMFNRLNALRRSKDPNARLLGCPGKSTVRHAIGALECFETVKAKWGEKRAVELYGSVGDGLTAARFLEKVVFDHTRIDTWVIFDRRRGWIRGRGWLTIAIDVFTRVILAWFITYRRPSTFTVIRLLKRMMRPKLWIRARYPHLRGEVNFFGKPAEIIVDHEWAHEGPSLRDSLTDLKVSIRWPDTEDPQAKAIGEAIFRTLNKLVFHREAGAVPLPAHEMRALGYDPAKDKLIDFDLLEEHIVTGIYDIYHREIHTGIGMAPARACKLEAAKWTIPIHDDFQTLDDALGTILKGLTLSKEGVTYNGIRYHDQDLVAGLLFDLAPSVPKRRRRKHGSVTVPLMKAKIDTENIDHLRIWNWKRDRYVRLPAAREFAEYVRDLPLDVHEQIQAFAKAHGFDFENEDERWAARDRYRQLLEAADPARLNEARVKQLRLLQALQEPAAALHGDEVTVVRTPSGPFGAVTIPIATDLPRIDGGAPPKIPRRGGRRATKGAAATRAKNRAKAAAEGREAARTGTALTLDPTSGRSVNYVPPPRSVPEDPQAFLASLENRPASTTPVHPVSPDNEPPTFVENLARRYAAVPPHGKV